MTSRKFNDLKILLWVLVGIPLIASTNMDCGGKSFLCLNSTHFRICVDLGGGLSTTVDDFVIPCPSPTICSHSNRFECEFSQPPGLSTTAASTIVPPAVPITLTSATNEFESATTLAWEEITVPTAVPFNTSVGYLELQNYTTVSITESLLIEVTTSASVKNTSQNETVTEIIPIPNTTFKPQITTEDILVTDSNLLNVTESVVQVSLNKTMVVPEVTRNATEANIVTSYITENKINETTVIPKIEVITNNATEANISTLNLINNNIKDTTANPQIEVSTSKAPAGNTITLNISENNINDTKAIPEIDVITTFATGTNNTITSNMTENNIVTKTYETSTDIDARNSDPNEANLNINNITSSMIKNITMDTSVTAGMPSGGAESGGAASKIDEMTVNVSTTPKFTKPAETMNTVGMTTTYPTIIVQEKASGVIEDSVNQSVISVEVNRKKATQVIDPITTMVPETTVNTDVSATLNSTFMKEVIATTTAINTDIATFLSSIEHNQAFVPESNIYISTETNVKETTIVTLLPETVSDSIFNANSLVEDIVTQNPIFNMYTESNVHKTTSTALQATEIVSDTEDILILNLETSNIEKNITTAVHNEHVADKVEEGIHTINVNTSISVPATIQKTDVVTFNSNNFDGEILVTTTVSNVNRESNVKESTGARNTIVSVISDVFSSTDINSTINLNVEDNITSPTVQSTKTTSNVTENTDVFNVPEVVVDATFNSITLIEEVTSPSVSKPDTINISTSINTNDARIISTTSPNFVTTVNSELTELTKTKNETTSPSSVSKFLNTEYKIRQNTASFETTTLNNVLPLFDTNSGGNNTVAVERRKAVSSVFSTRTTTTDNIIKTQTPMSELDIIKSTTETPRDFTTKYSSTFSELFDNRTTTNTKINNQITADNTITKVAANNNKTISVNALTNEILEEKANIVVNNVESGISIGNHSLLDIDIQLNTTYATINETAAASENDSSLRSSAKSSDIMSTTENYQIHIPTTNDHQLSFETATNVLPKQLGQDKIGNRFDISEVKTDVSHTTDDTTNAAKDTNILLSNNTNGQITIDTITPNNEVLHSKSTVFVTEYLTTGAPSTEAQLKRDSGIVIDKKDTSTRPISNHVYITTSQNELQKTADNTSDSGNTANQVHMAPSLTYFPTESSLLDEATTNDITTPQSASKVQTSNTSRYNLSIGLEPFSTSDSIIITTASILESEINATGIEIAIESTVAENNLDNDKTSTERTNAISTTLMPKVTLVAPDPMTSIETVVVMSTTQDNKISYDTGVPEKMISAVKDSNNPAINNQLFNVSTTERTPEILLNVHTERACNNCDLIKTDIKLNSVGQTEGNLIPSGNDIQINKKLSSKDIVTPVGNVDKFDLSISLQINNLTIKQNELINTTTKEASTAKINTENGNTTSITRSQTDGLLTQISTTNEYERNSSLQPLNSQNNVQNGLDKRPETRTSTQTMTRVTDSVYVSPSMDSIAVQGTFKSDKAHLGTTEIIITDKRDHTTDSAVGDIYATTALPTTVNAVPVKQDAIIFDTSSHAMMSAESNTNIDSLLTNNATWETAIVQENINSDASRSINTIASKTIPVTEYENKNSILSAINSTTSPDSGMEISNLTNPLGNVKFNISEASANHHLTTSLPVATIVQPAGTEGSSQIQLTGSVSVKDRFFTSQTEKYLPESTSTMTGSTVHFPDATVSVVSNIDTNEKVFSPNTVTWEKTTVPESISNDIRRYMNKDALEIIPLTQNVNQVNTLANVANKSTASPNSSNHISNITNSLENVVFNMQDDSANDNLTMLAAITTTSRLASIPTSTENSSSMIQSTGSLSFPDGFWNGQKNETENIATPSLNIYGNLTSFAKINGNVSVLSDRVEILPQFPNINSSAINQHDKKSTTSGGVINQIKTNSQNLPNTDNSKMPILISENIQNTENVVNEDENAVQDPTWRPTLESAKSNFNNISLSVQSTSILSITTSNVKLNVTETTFTNSSMEFHTAVSKSNVNTQPSTDHNTESLPNRVLAKTSPLNDDKTNNPVIIIDKEKVNKDHNVNIELSIVQKSNQTLTGTSTSNTQTATIIPKSSNTATATEANVRQTQTTRNTIGSTHPVVTTGHLSILNTVKVDVESTNVERNLTFDCQNRMRGRYSDNTDCRKFYICIGMRQPIVGLCPVNTVFSEIKKQCTKNLSYCVRQNQFKCVKNGRFSDFLEHNVYFICVKNRREEFVRFKLQCQSGYKLNKITVRCVEDEPEPPNKSTSNDSEVTIEKYSSSNSRDVSKTSDSSHSTNQNSKGNVMKKVKDKSSSKRKEGNKDFVCEEEGKFHDPKSCRRYYVCSKSNRSEEYRQKRKKCDSDEVFHKDKKKCVDADSFQCS